MSNSKIKVRNALAYLSGASVTKIEKKFSDTGTRKSWARCRSSRKVNPWSQSGPLTTDDALEAKESNGPMPENFLDT